MPEQHDIYTWQELVDHMLTWESKGYPGNPLEYYNKTWKDIATRACDIRESEFSRLAIGFRPKPFPECKKVWIEAYMIKENDGVTVLSPNTNYSKAPWILYPEDCNIVEDAPGTWVPQTWDEMIWASNNPRCVVEYKEVDSENDWIDDPCVADDYINYKYESREFINGTYKDCGDVYTHRVTGPRP